MLKTLSNTDELQTMTQVEIDFTLALLQDAANAGDEWAHRMLAGQCDYYTFTDGRCVVWS